jgi:hypothetical protein
VTQAELLATGSVSLAGLLARRGEVPLPGPSKAQKVFDGAALADQATWISDTVLVEPAWTLS